MNYTFPLPSDYTYNDECTFNLREEWRMWLKVNMNFLRKMLVWNRFKIVTADTIFPRTRVRVPRERGKRVCASVPFLFIYLFIFYFLFLIHTINEIKHTDLVKPSSRDKTDTKNLTARRAHSRTRAGYSAARTRPRITRCTYVARGRA